MTNAVVGENTVSDDTTVGNRYLRNTSTSGAGEVTTLRGGVWKSRDASTSGEGEGGTERGGVVKPRDSAASGRGAVTSTRVLHSYRTPVVTGEAVIDSTQVLTPVFPDEESLDVQWDFDVDQMAFITEWLDEDSIIPEGERDGLGVDFNGGIENPPVDVWIQYDETGDGVVDVTSDVQQLHRTRQTLTFDDSSLFGSSGWYRVVVQGLRTEDVINQVDIGAVHKNL